MTGISTPSPLPIVVLISGEGTNLQAILDAAAGGDLPVTVRAVVSNRAAAGGLERARRAGIPVEVVNHRDYADRSAFDAALQRCIDRYRPALVVLAGFMRVLTAGFVRHYHGRLLNIHPSLLPRFPGLNTHQRALDAEAADHGASVHFVTEEVDGGPVVLQARVPVHPGDDAATLAARVLAREHGLYITALRWFAQGRLRLVDGVAELDGRALSRPLDLDRDGDARP